MLHALYEFLAPVPHIVINQQADVKERKQFRSKICLQEEHNKKVEWINSIKKIKRTWRRFWDEYTPGFAKSNCQVSNWKTPTYDSIHGF